NLARITNGTPAFPGSPSRTAICAPAGRVAGAGPHLMSDGAIATCFAMVGLAAGAAFFAVCALAAPAAIAMADVTAMSVVRTLDIGVSLLNEMKWTLRIIRGYITLMG